MMKIKKIELKGEVIKNTEVPKLLSVYIDDKLKFYAYTETLCKKVRKSFMPLLEL